MNTITGVHTALSTETGTNGSPVNGLGREAFLQLLVTQLKYQNPLEPAKDQEFIAQLAQFSVLEELTAVRETMETLADGMDWNRGLFARSLVLLGRTAHFELTDGRVLEGTVSALRQTSEGPRLVVGDHDFSFDEIKEVELL